MISQRKLGAVCVALFAALWFVGANVNPAFAAHDQYETKIPTFADFDQYCQDRVHAQGAVTLSPGDAYSYNCYYSGGKHSGINMHDLCYSVNADYPTHYRDQSVDDAIAAKARAHPDLLLERLDLPHFAHPGTYGGHEYTGWTCFWRDTPYDPNYWGKTDPFTLTKADFDFYCQNVYASSNSRGANPPSRADLWTCLDSGGRPSADLTIDVRYACDFIGGHKPAVTFGGWIDRTGYVFNPNSIQCYW